MYPVIYISSKFAAPRRFKMKRPSFLNFFIVSILLFLHIPLCANDAAGGHTGNITALIHKGDRVINTAENGYIVIWDIAKKAASERFQMTFNEIQALVSHTQKDEICSIIKTGGLDSSIIIEQPSFAYPEKKGRISYMNMYTSLLLNNFDAPGNLSNLVIFNNNNLLAGINQEVYC
jgi:predicted membrane-bound dolichyl-phosphate-mannose-protein mannosyltransferase